MCSSTTDLPDRPAEMPGRAWSCLRLAGPSARAPHPLPRRTHHRPSAPRLPGRVRITQLPHLCPPWALDPERYQRIRDLTAKFLVSPLTSARCPYQDGQDDQGPGEGRGGQAPCRHHRAHGQPPSSTARPSAAPLISPSRPGAAQIEPSQQRRAPAVPESQVQRERSKTVLLPPRCPGQLGIAR
jgi:hypothetical protein